MFKKRMNNINRVVDNFANKKGQVTIFIIIAIVLVASVAAFFIFRGVITEAEVPANLEPVYNSFLSCIEEETLVGIGILEAQGGYIELPEFEPGSAYMPFSSQLNFLGNPIPYWYYVSGNNIQKEQVPSKTEMQEALGDYISDSISNCVLDEWYGEGYTIIPGEDPSASVTINENTVDVVLDMPLRMEKANDTVLISSHDVSVDSKLGSLYQSARDIYDYEQETLFLENYGVDTLRLYAPVDGVELTCSPKIWSADEVFDDLENAIEVNVNSIKVENPDLTLRTEEDKYYLVDVPVSENVRFLNSRRWPHSFDVNPAEGGILSAEPVGNQPGMAALGFCYVPYHFVYDVNYPVLVQVYSDEGEELFQFPFAVVIQGNVPREALDAEAVDVPDAELCEFRNTQMTVNTYDNSLQPVETNISFRCFGEICDIGQTQGGTLTGMFPQCVNGFIVADAEGFRTSEYYIESSAESSTVDVLMNKLYEKRVEVSIDNSLYSGQAVVNFASEETGFTDSIIYPDQNTIELSEGQYEIQVYIYRNTSIEIPETTQEQCMEVPTDGIGGFFGFTREKCFDVTIPEQEINNALNAGGTQSYYMVESELQSTDIIDINVKSLPTPESIEDLQTNYNLLETQDLDIVFR